VYKTIVLNLARIRKKRLPAGDPLALDASVELNRFCSIHFMSDGLYHGRRFRTLSGLDDGVWEAQRFVIDTSNPTGRAVRTLEQFAAWCGYTKALRRNKGEEMISATLEAWCAEHRVKLRFIQAGKPNPNSCVERFNRTYGHEVLDADVLRT
jgi:putative transposase